MDGFGITSSLRDFERARRNRTSTVRAAAVEEHGKLTTAASTRGHGLERDVLGETICFVCVSFCFPTRDAGWRAGRGGVEAS